MCPAPASAALPAVTSAASKRLLRTQVSQLARFSAWGTLEVPLSPLSLSVLISKMGGQSQSSESWEMGGGSFRTSKAFVLFVNKDHRHTHMHTPAHTHTRLHNHAHAQTRMHMRARGSAHLSSTPRPQMWLPSGLNDIDLIL